MDDDALSCGDCYDIAHDEMDERDICEEHAMTDDPDDLVTWLRVALDEEEAAARVATKDQWIADGTRVTDAAGSTVARMAVPSGLYQQRMADAAHIARHDPARVLREVEAKRQIIGEVLRYEAKIDSEWGCCHDAESIGAGSCPEINPNEIQALRLLAMPYADRPGYRDEWRP